MLPEGVQQWNVYRGEGYAYQSARTFFSDVPITFVLRKNEVVIPLYGRVGEGEIFFVNFVQLKAKTQNKTKKQKKKKKKKQR